MRGIPDHVVEWQQFIENYWAKEKERLGTSYLVALHNLHLPEGRLTLENQKDLSYIVFNFIEPIAESLEAPPTIGNNRPPALGIHTPLGRFMFMPDMMGYPEPDEKGIHLPGKEAWWNSDDFDAFQRNYRHLCGVIKGCIEGENYWNFCRADIEWLEEKMGLIHNEVYFRIKVKNPPLNSGKTSPERKIPQNRPPLIPLCQLDNIPFETFSPVITPKFTHFLPPSDLILHQAYLEIIDVINNQKAFRRCKNPDCNQIFIPTRKNHEYHTKKCLWRYHRQQKRGKPSPQENVNKQTFSEHFPSDEALEKEHYEFLKNTLYPKGLHCPSGHSLPKEQSPHERFRSPIMNYRCRECGKVFNIFTNTIWSRSRNPCSTIVRIIKGFDLGTPIQRLAKELGIDRSHLSKRKPAIEEFSKQYFLSPPPTDQTA